MKERARAILRHAGVLRTWAKAKWTLIDDVKEWNAQIQFLKANGVVSPVKSASSADWYVPYTYRVDENYKPYYIHLFFSDSEGQLNVWKINSIQPSKIRGQGRSANQIEKDIFEACNRVSERVAFGYCDRAIISKCVPKQLYYIDRAMLNKTIDHVSKADYSSHYPSNLCGRMPTWENHIEVNGTVKPSEEYPFAYYIKSGHFAELNVVDTHDWLNHPLVMCLFGENYDPHVDESDDVTILCKASEYDFDYVINYLYEKKQKDEYIDEMSPKIILNASIGYKHLKNLNAKQNRLDHVAVVALCRANQKMISHFQRGKTLMMVVDSVIYRGEDEIGIKEKKLGELHQEITDATFRMRGVNQYAFEKNGRLISYAHSGFDDVHDIKSVEDIDKYQKNDIIKIER